MGEEEEERLHRLLTEVQGNKKRQDVEGVASSIGLDRFVRVKPTKDGDETEIRQALVDLGGEIVEWFPGEAFYLFPSTFRLAPSPLYRLAKIYGMDISSGVAILALDPQPGESILDLCCCPGLKLCMIADSMKGRGSVTGVDISRTRLAICRQVLIKYSIGRTSSSSSSLLKSTSKGGKDLPAHGGEEEKQESKHDGLWCRLLCTDGQSFHTGPQDPWEGSEEDVIFDSRAYDWHGMEERGQKRMNRGSRRKEMEALREILTSRKENQDSHEGSREGEGEFIYYDRVLVDADCTHDGSVRHMGKVATIEEERRSQPGKFLGSDRLQGLEALQRGLIRQGFHLLRPNGIMVYSTCSLSTQQNEVIVQHLLEEEPSASLDHIEIGRPMYDKNGDGIEEGNEEEAAEIPLSSALPLLPCRWGDLPGTLVFEPRFGTSGLFIARIRKAKL